jgi:YaiO family outer membrane protein
VVQRFFRGQELCPWSRDRQGREKKYQVTVRGEFGSELYQIIPPDVGVSNFPSHAISVSWRQWIRRDWGVTVGAGYYSSAYYQSKSAELGFFKDF